MSTTDLTHERAAAKRDNGTRNGHEPNWSDQVVLSGAGLLTGSIERTRANTTALMDVLDELVLGTLDIVDELNAASAELLPKLATRPAELARKAYTTASGALRQTVVDA